MNGKKIAQVIRDDDQYQLILDDINDNQWIVSDGFCMFVLSNDEYQDFKKKWNSYKTTENIPSDIKEYHINTYGTKTTTKENSPDWDNVIPDFEFTESLNMFDTDIRIGDTVIYKAVNSNNMIRLDQKYTQFIEDYWDVFAYPENTYKKTVQIDSKNGDMKMVIMPIRNMNKEGEYTVKETLENYLECNISFNSSKDKKEAI